MPGKATRKKKNTKQRNSAVTTAAREDEHKRLVRCFANTNFEVNDYKDYRAELEKTEYVLCICPLAISDVDPKFTGFTKGLCGNRATLKLHYIMFGIVSRFCMGGVVWCGLGCAYTYIHTHIYAWLTRVRT